MEIAARLARVGNALLGIMALMIILTMFLYGSYSLWDTFMVFRGAFVSGDLLMFKPADSGMGIENPSLEQLQALNEDVRGWLCIDDTHIDYPVVQGEDDMGYINRDVYGEFSLSGSIFLSSVNSPDFSDGYSLVYGHHMEHGGMFGDVVNFTDTEYFRGHLSGKLYLTDAAYEIELFACMETDAYDPVIYQPQNQKEGDISELLNYLKKHSVQYREIGVEAEDSVIGLSTCAQERTDGRVILFGRLRSLDQTQEGGVTKEHE